MFHGFILAKTDPKNKFIFINSLTFFIYPKIVVKCINVSDTIVFMLKESYLYHKLGKEKAQCKTCSHYCVIPEGQRGKCGVRENQNGEIYSLNFGKACLIKVEPIEKNPFYHYLPGTKTLSVSSVGCNFSCHNCHTWQMSQEPKILKSISGKDIMPEKIVKYAVKNNIRSITYAHTEPTVFFEYAFNTMYRAKKEGLKNLWVTNGYFSKEALEKISPYLDAANVDLKSFSDEFYRENCGAALSPVLDNLKALKKKNIWIEVSTLAMPRLSDSEKMFKDIAVFIKNNLGANTPWHINQFHGHDSWKTQILPDTPMATLENAHKIGEKAGLKFVYINSFPGSEKQDTYCPECKAKMIDRMENSIIRYDRNGRCTDCGQGLNIALS